MSSTPGHSWKAGAAPSTALDAAGQRLGRGVGLIRAAGGLPLQHVDVDLGAGGGRRFGDHAGQSFELLVEVFLRVEATVDREPRGSGNGVETGAGAGLSADDEHRASGLLALDREAGALLEQFVRERGQWLGDADHVLEGVDALVDVADVRLAAMGSDAQRDRAAAGVPDHAAGGLGGEHGDRFGVDQPGLAQVPGAGGAAGLLVADEVEDDLRPSSRPSSLAAAAP